MRNRIIIFSLVLGLLFTAGCQNPRGTKKDDLNNAALDQQASDIVQSDQSNQAGNDFEWGKKHGLGSF